MKFFENNDIASSGLYGFLNTVARISKKFAPTDIKWFKPTGEQVRQLKQYQDVVNNDKNIETDEKLFQSTYETIGEKVREMIKNQKEESCEERSMKESYEITYPDGSKGPMTLDNLKDAPYDDNTLTGDYSSISLGNYNYYYKIGKDKWLYADHNPHVLGGQCSSETLYKTLTSKKESKFPKMEAQEADDNLILSPDMSATYTGKNSVPLRLQLLRKAIAEETKSISDYEGFITSGNFAPDEITEIQEIANDEKDHLVKWTRMLSKMTEKEYSQFGNESLQKSNKSVKVENKSKNGLKFF